MKKIIIYEDVEKTVIALKENGKVLEIYELPINSAKQEGNIYCGIVRNIIPGMQSAFIDINENKNAFIHIKDILPKVSNETGNKDEKFEKYNIKDYIKVGDTILVQAKKDIEGKKGARVTKHISLTGKYVVVMPNTNFITVSQKIEDKETKDLLIKKVEKIISEEVKKEKYGIIIRTAALHVDDEYLREDIKELIKTYKQIVKKYSSQKENKKPIKIYDESSYTKKMLIGIINDEEYEIVVNKEEKYAEVKEIVDKLANKKVTVELINENLLEKFELDKELEEIKQRKIWLKCGGFIAIDKTEALTAIDVNSGKFVGNKNKTKEETLYKVNEEATIEIARQMRLRNIGGIIVIDYIDMEDANHRKKIIQMLEKEIKKDRAKVQIIDFTKLDLLEITRKKL